MIKLFPVTLIMLAALTAIVVGQNLPHWNGQLTGLADPDGEQMGPLNPLTTTSPGGSPDDATVSIGTTPVDIFAANPARIRLKLINTDFITSLGGNGVVQWCRYATVAAGPAIPHGTDSFPLFAGGGIDDQGPGVDRRAVNCVSESDTTPPLLYRAQY